MTEGAGYPHQIEGVETRNIFTEEVKAMLIDTDEIDKEFRYFRLIKSILHCNVEVFSQKVFVLKGRWKIAVFLKAFISFIDLDGEKEEIVKFVTLNKEIPFPLTDHHQPMFFSTLPAYLDILAAHCVEVSFENHDFCSFVKLGVELKYRLVATKKVLLKVLAVEHQK